MPLRCSPNRSTHSPEGAARLGEREVWRQLLAAVDRSFRHWHRDRSYVRSARTVLALVRDPDRDVNVIEARIADNGHTGRSRARDGYWHDPAERDTPPPHP